MNIYYRVDVLKQLKEHNWTTYKLRKEKVMGERTLQQIRDGVPVSWEIVSRLCDLLGCDVGDLLTVQPELAYQPEYNPQGEMEQGTTGFVDP